MSGGQRDVDESALAVLLTEGGPDFFREIILLYLDDTPRLLTGLRAGLQADDRENVQRYAHMLRGSSKHLGARAVEHLAEVVEREAPAGSLLRLEALVSDLELTFATARQLLTGALP